MAIIIPSKNIFQIQNEKINDNAINKVNSSYNAIIETSGNILKQEYTYTYFDVNINEDGNNTVNPIYSNSENTNGDKLTFGAPYLYGTITLKIDKQCVINLESTFPYTFIIKQNIFNRSDGTTDTIIKRDIKPSIISYDVDTNILEVMYKTQIYGSGKNTNAVVISETIQLVGDYIEEKSNEKIFGITDLEKVFTNGANELINDKVIYNNEPLYEHIANREISEYGNGKETATIVCGIANYYDENGNKVISIDEPYKSMVFSLYQKVIPYIYDSNRKDRPMSRYKDGTPKTFQIVGVEPYYDGAVWQKLILQEVTN